MSLKSEGPARTIIERLKTLEAAATPGPWLVEQDNFYGYIVSVHADRREVARTVAHRGLVPANERFIAEMRNASPKLWAHIEELEAKNTALKESLALADSPDSVTPGFWGRMCAYYSIRNKKLLAAARHLERAEAILRTEGHDTRDIREALAALEADNV